jgi:hypothetical protein
LLLHGIRTPLNDSIDMKREETIQKGLGRD